MEVPQVVYIDKTVDVPVVRQGQVPTVQTVQEVPQVSFLDRVVDVLLRYKDRRSKNESENASLKKLVSLFHVSCRKPSKLRS